MQLFIQKISIAIVNKNIHNQNDAQKSGQLRYIKKLSIAQVQTKVINCNFANKVVSCNLCTQKLSQLRRNLAIFLLFVVWGFVPIRLCPGKFCPSGFSPKGFFYS